MEELIRDWMTMSKQLQRQETHRCIASQSGPLIRTEADIVAWDVAAVASVEAGFHGNAFIYIL